jgi:hypothetical protein
MAAKYRFREIADFDARRGYKARGGAKVPHLRYVADANSWRAPNGDFVMRWTSQGYKLHVKAELSSGIPIPDEVAEDDRFWDVVAKAMRDWLNEGVDDAPNCFYDN